MNFPWNEFIVQSDWMITMAQVLLVLTGICVVGGLTYYKKWKWLYTEWLTSVDHKKIGVMYIISAIIMFFRGGVDALLIRLQLMTPDNTLLKSQHYNEIFTTHGVIMIIFMAMPFLIGLMNVVVPLQLGARDVAFPMLNNLSFWLFAAGMG